MLIVRDAQLATESYPARKAQVDPPLTRTPLSEPDLLERARAADAEAFEALVEIHSDRVYGALRSFGLAGDEALPHRLQRGPAQAASPPAASRRVAASSPDQSGI